MSRYTHVIFDFGGVITASPFEAFNRLEEERGLPRATAPGDVMAIADAGAYGYSMASTYNLRALPAEDIVE